MAKKSQRQSPDGNESPSEQDRVSLAPLDPIESVKAMLAVDPDSKPAPQLRKKKPAKKG